MSRDEFLHRPVTVKVYTRCDRCAELKEDAEPRKNDHYKVRGTYCLSCYYRCCDEAYAKTSGATLC